MVSETSPIWILRHVLTGNLAAILASGPEVVTDVIGEVEPETKMNMEPEPDAAWLGILSRGEMKLKGFGLVIRLHGR